MTLDSYGYNAQVLSIIAIMQTGNNVACVPFEEWWHNFRFRFLPQFPALAILFDICTKNPYISTDEMRQTNIIYKERSKSDSMEFPASLLSVKDRIDDQVTLIFKLL